MDVKLPDGTVVQNVPDNITKDQLTAKLQSNGYDISKLNAAPTATPTPSSPPPPGIIQRIFNAGMKGSKFGPEGMMIGAGNELYNSAQGALDKAGYVAGGKVTDIASDMGASPPIAAGLGAVTNTAISQGPSLIAGGAFAKGAAPLLQGASRELMQSALKPSVKALKTGQAGQAIDTMLKEGINVTSGGVEKLRSRIGALNDQVTNALAGSNATVDKAQVASRIQDVISRIERTNPTPQDAVKDVEKVYDQFVANKLLPQNIPVQRAQELKTGIYKTLKDAYGMLSSDTVEAKKALARGFKEEVAAKVPAITPLNEEESKLLSALSLTERRVLVSANKNPLSFAALIGNPLRMATFMADRSELFKSLVARMLNAGATQVPATAARVGIGANALTNQQPQQ